MFLENQNSNWFVFWLQIKNYVADHLGEEILSCINDRKLIARIKWIAVANYDANFVCCSSNMSLYA